MAHALLTSSQQPDSGRMVDQNVPLKYSADLGIFPKADQVLIKLGEMTIQCPPDTLLILDTFRTPVSMSEAVKRLQPHFNKRGALLRMMATISTLVKQGALVPASDENVSQPSTLSLHRLLLRDEFRTLRYLDALRAVVRPDDVVLDIGTGSGILAAAAALAGARHVYAIEANAMANVARKVFEANGLTDKITLIQAWSNDIELPERADVLVSEIISNGIFGQNILRATQDAAQRLLKPNARLIPARVRLYAMLAEIGADWFGKQQFTPEQVTRWKSLYGVDFAPLLDFQTVTHFEEVQGSTASEWTYLSDPVLLTDIDLTHIDSLSIETITPVQVKQSGTIHAVVLYFEADMAPGMTMTTNPLVTDRPFAWANPVCLFDPVQAAAGDSLRVHLLHSETDPLRYAVSLEPA